MLIQRELAIIKYLCVLDTNLILLPIKYKKQLLISLLGLLLFCTPSCKSKKGIVKTKENKSEFLSERFLYAIGQKNILDYKKAEAALQKCLSIDKNHSATLFHLADIALRTNQQDKALNYIDRAIESDKNNYWNQELKARIYNAKNDYINEVKVYETLHKSYPNKLIYLKMLIVAYQKSGNLEQALLFLDKKIELNGILSKDVKYKEWMLIRQGKKLDIIADYEMLQRKYPENSDIIKKLVALYTEKKELVSANKWRIKLGPNNLNDIDSYRAGLLMYKKQNNKKKYISTFNNALKSDEINLLDKMSIIQEARNYQLLSNAEKIIILNSSEKLSIKNPKSSKLNSLVAERFMLNGDYIKALNYYKIAYQGDDARFTDIEKAVNIAYDLYDTKELHEITNYGMSIFPNMNKLYFWKSKAYLMENNTEKARAFIRTGLNYSVHRKDEVVFELLEAQINKKKIENININEFDTKEPLLEYAQYLMNVEKDNNGALSIIERAIKLNKSDDLLLKKAKILFLIDKLEMAKKLNLTVLENKPNHIVALELIGDIYKKEGNIEKANENWKMALSLGSKSILLKEKIK